jgi:hypothetical protein
MRNKNTRLFVLLGPLAMAVALSGLACVSTPDAPNQKLTQSIAAISAADAAGAEDDPRAALHLQLAKEQLAKAKQLIAEREMDRAELMLRRASADAEFAMKLAKQRAAFAEAERIKKEVVALEQGAQE